MKPFLQEKKGTGCTDMEKKRIVWIELLRIAACIGVIGLHAGSQHFRDIPIDTFAWKTSNFFHGINRFAVDCFIMISGSLYLSKKRTWNLKKLWIGNILPVFTAYVFWQVFYGIYRIIVAGNIPLGSKEFIKKMMVYVSSPYFHLWYLPMLIGLLIITPLIWEIVNSSRGKQWSEYIIILFLIFHVFTYTAGKFQLPWKEHVQALMNTIHPELVTGYIGFLVLGHYLYEYGLPKKLERLTYILGVIFIFTGMYLCQVESLKTGNEVQAFYENYTLAGFFWSSSVFLFFRNKVSRISWSEKQEKRICALGGCTFGIYLIHVLVRDILYRKGIDSMMMDNTILAILIVIALIFLISWALVFILRKIPFVKKWIM